MLADTTPHWRPRSFEVGRWDSRLGLLFPSVKLLDYASAQAEPAEEDNPFATVVLAHLAAQATRKDVQARYTRKLKLTRRLYQRRMSKQQIIDLYRFIDWGRRVLGAQTLDDVFGERDG